MSKLTKCVSSGSMMIAGLLMVGCNTFSRVRNTPPVAENPSPLVVDQAMQLRDWDRVTAKYANGDTIAGPTGMPYQMTPGQPEWRYAAVESPLSIGQSVAMPVTLVITPPWTSLRYTGDTVEPTYTAMPALP